MEDAAKRADLFVVAFVTQNLASLGSTLSQLIALVPSKSSSKVLALKLPHLRRILSAVLIFIFALVIPSAPARKVTLPSETSVISYPSFCISRFSTASSPKWHGAISSKVSSIIFPPKPEISYLHK